MKTHRLVPTALLLMGALSCPCVVAVADDVEAETDVPMDVEGAHDSPWSYLQDKYDADGDGVVSPEEYNRSDAAFGRLDQDEDGALTQKDFAQRGRPERRGGGQRGARPQGTPEGEAAPDFTLRPLHLDPEVELEDQLVTLSSFVDDRPVALIFGSYT